MKIIHISARHQFFNNLGCNTNIIKNNNDLNMVIYTFKKHNTFTENSSYFINNCAIKLSWRENSIICNSMHEEYLKPIIYPNFKQKIFHLANSQTFELKTLIKWFFRIKYNRAKHVLHFRVVEICKCCSQNLHLIQN